MKKIVLGLCLALVTLASASAADAALPVPLPREKPHQLVLAQATTATNPDPFNRARVDNGPPTIQASAPAPTPIVVAAPAAPQGDSVLSYIWAAIGAVFTAIFGKLAFKLPSGGSHPIDAGKVTDIVTAVLHPSGTSILADPMLRAAVDTALLKVVESGIPGQAIQGGLGLVPGAAPFAATLEPIVRNIVIRALQKRAAPDAGAGTPAPTDSLQDKLTALTAIVEGLAKGAIAKPAAAA